MFLGETMTPSACSEVGLRIVVADDHTMVRAGLKATLGPAVVAEASDGEQVVLAVTRQLPDLLILKVNMPGPSTEQVISRALAAVPKLKVLILAGSVDTSFLSHFQGMPIHGYILQGEDTASLLQAVRTIGQGAVWFSQAVAQHLMSLNRGSQQGASRQFSTRENQVLELLGEGHTNREIASRLHLAEQTVRNSLCTLYSKLHVSSRLEAVLRARGLSHDSN